MIKHLKTLADFDPLLTPEQEAASAHLYGMFPLMVDVLPAGIFGSVEIKHSRPSWKEAYLNARARNELRTLDPLCQLDINGIGWMFDTLHEKWMNRTAVVNARGDVLIGGLGLGLILWPILRKSSVRSVTVLENNPDVIALVEPTLRAATGYEKLRILEVDAREFTSDRLYDYIWLDCVPAYGYGSKMLDLQGSWIKGFEPFLKPSSRRHAFQCDHWGYQEGILYALHGDTPPGEWPKADRRAYPIGPGDPLVVALAKDRGIDFMGHKPETPGVAELMRPLEARLDPF